MLVLALTGLILLAAAEARGQGCDTSPLMIRNVNVWTPGGLVPNRDVFMWAGQVMSIQPHGDVTSHHARVLDGAGHTLLPGLIDAHVHFSVPGGLPRTGNAPRTDTAAITGRQLLRSGVTSGRLHLAGLSEAVELKKRSLDPCAEMPRLQVGGPGLSGALEKDVTAFQGARTAAQATEKVHRFAAAGVDWLAIHDAHRFAPGVLTAIGDAARKAGVRLMASGSSPAETLAALSIKPDTLDYIDRTMRAGHRNDVLDRIRAAKDLVLVPTVGVAFRATMFRATPARLEEPGHFRNFSPEDAAFVRANAKKDMDTKFIADVLAYAPMLANKLKELRSLGLPVALGSDAGSQLHFQSNAIWWEMEAWRAAGASHREILIAATEHGARVLKLSDVGHLRPGARPDFVLYRGNVEQGAFDIARVSVVGKGGYLIAQ